MKKALMTFAIIISWFFGFSQANGFYIEFDDPEGDTWRVGGVHETENGFLFSLRDMNSSIMKSKLVKMSLGGELLDEKSYSAADSSINLCHIFPCPNESGCIEVLGVCTAPNGDAFLMMLLFDDELNELNRFMFQLPSSDSVDYRMDDFRFLPIAEGCYALLSYQRMPTEKEIKLCRVSNEDGVIQVERMEDTLVAYVANLFHVQNDPEGLGIFLHKQKIQGSHVNSCAMLYDGNLELKRIYDINNWYEDDGYGNIYSGDLSLFNSQMRPSPDGGYYISSRLNEFALNGTIAVSDRSSVMAKTDSSFHIQPRYNIIGHLNDTVEAPSFYNSIDVNEEGIVYQCSMQNIIFGSWPYGSNGTHLVVTKTDIDLNVLWQKRFMKDGKIYSAFQTMATSDGGCLILGNVYDHNPERSQSVFIMKVDANGTVGVEELQEESVAFVYPNPAKETFTISGVEAKETQVYNTLGQRIMTFRGNVANVDALSEGVYLLRVTDGDGLTQTLRLIVNK